MNCWGSDEQGQTYPPSEGGFGTVGAGDSYACDLRSDGKLECWGTFDGIDSNSP